MMCDICQKEIGGEASQFYTHLIAKKDDMHNLSKQDGPLDDTAYALPVVIPIANTATIANIGNVIFVVMNIVIL